LLFAAVCAYAESGDFNIDGMYEAAIDLPRILFILKREPNDPPLEVEGNFELNYAFLDTGASGVLLSRETTELMGIAVEPNAQFVDTGVAGEEYFDVSESLYIGTADYKASDPYNPSIYSLAGPRRFQIKQTYAGLFPIDVLGVPVMAGKSAVLDSGGTNDLEYFTADIKEANDPAIPQVDFKLALRFEKYIVPEDSRNIPPLPVLAYNPVIDNIAVEYNGVISTGTWLFDTGATVSAISTAQSFKLGLTDEYGEPIITPDFYVDIGGIGGSITIPGFQIDNLIIPTLCGYNLVFNNARVTVHDVGIFNETTGEFIILDGIFGSNFLCATFDTLTYDMSATPFDRIVIDTKNALLGFNVNDIYPLPTCNDMGMPWPVSDFNRDYFVDLQDLHIFADEWLGDCDWLNWNCRGADMNLDSTVNFGDYANFADNW